MKNRNEIQPTSMEYSDFGLGLKMQAESSDLEKTRPGFPFSQYQFDSAGSSSNITAGGGRGGGPFFWNISGGSMDDIYASGTAGCGGAMAVNGESLFTPSQLHELERQQIIHKYMMASIPVPHELMSPVSRTSPSPQSKMCAASGSGADSRFSSSKLDPEPWRCRRTDGKKWRCSRNAAADQRYCDRHSHKNKPRSRKHVEAKNSTPTSVMPPPPGAIPYDQLRRIEWCTRGGSSSTTNIPVSTCNYRQQMQQISSRLDLIMNRDNTLHQENVSQSQTLLHQQDFMTPVLNRFESKIIDAWEQEEMKGLSPSSLTLSMSSNPVENDQRFGVDDNERPGGPLGEALCLGNNARNLNLRSSNDYTYTSSSPSEDGSHHAFKFIS